MSRWNLQEANARLEANKKFIVRLDRDEDGPTLEFEFSPREQQTLIDKHLHVSYSESEGAEIELKDMPKMAIATLKWLLSWENFDGEMSKEILKQSCQNFPTLATAISSGFYGEFISKQEAVLHDNEEAVKNS